MKFPINPPSAFQEMSKPAVRIISAILWLCLISLVGLGLYSCYLQSWDMVGMFVLLVAIVAFCLIYPIISAKAYIEIEGQNIKVVNYILFVKRERVVQFSQIHKASIEVIRTAGSHAYIPYKYCQREIVFKNEDGKRLFCVFFNDKSYAFFKDYIVNYDEYLKSIR